MSDGIGFWPQRTPGDILAQERIKRQRRETRLLKNAFRNVLWRERNPQPKLTTAQKRTRQLERRENYLRETGRG